MLTVETTCNSSKASTSVAGSVVRTYPEASLSIDLTLTRSPAGVFSVIGQIMTVPTDGTDSAGADVRKRENYIR